MTESRMKRLVWCLSIAVVLPLNVSSQTPSTAISQSSSNGQFTLKTVTEVVLVNVTARDKNDNFIKDLKAEDFTILEDGRRQQIISLDVENTDSVVSTEPPRTPLLGNLDPASRASAPTRPAPVQDNDLKDRRLIVL